MGIRRQSFFLGSLAAVIALGSFPVSPFASASPVQVQVEGGEVRDVMFAGAHEGHEPDL